MRSLISSRCRPTPGNTSGHRAAAALLTLLAVLLAANSGCQLNRSFFQMDSNSRMPFLGVDLTPRWPRRSSSVDGVSRLQSEPVPAKAQEPADADVAAPKSLALPQSDRVTSTAEADEAPVEQFR